MKCLRDVLYLFISLILFVLVDAIDNSEFLVHYHGYWHEWKRREFFSHLLLFYPRYTWTRLEKHSFLQNIPSDFDVIKLNNPYHANRILSLVKNQTFVKYISHQAQWRRSLLDEDQGKNSSFNGRVLLSLQSAEVPTLLRAEILHNLGYWGEGVRVGVFDTGLNRHHPHFNESHIRERINWTNEPTVEDGVGHGTFVTGIIAGKSTSACPGFAPKSDLYIFRVFTNAQLSYTSWFLDAFNYAIAKKIHIINLSIGGPDYTDRPFVEKVYEISANNIILISAIGNDGPLYGTINNPADHMEVIGVGGIDYEDRIARFSSRGMTTWELPHGYGRVKPDVVTYSSTVWGSALNGDCKVLSGTTVASAVTAGAISLLYSAVLHRGAVINPGSMKQAVIASARRLEFSSANLFEQGFGALDLINAYQILKTYKPQATFSPSYLDFTQCPYFWPYCVQALYYSARPVVFNVTILNGMGVIGYVTSSPEWHVYSDAKETTDFLHMAFTYSKELWPWAGYLAIHFTVSEAAAHFTGVVEGFVTLTVTSPQLLGDTEERVTHLRLPIRVKIEAVPTRNKRLLWDQYHNLRYPPGYFPRDDLRGTTSPLDWNGDHPHTNFKGLFEHLRRRGYHIEILGEPLTCFDASHYGTLLLTDMEEEFHPDEIKKLHNDVKNTGLNVFVFADWFNTTIMNKIKFFDENSRQWWTPQTGGANVPSLNNLLSPYGIELGDRIFEGRFAIGSMAMHYQSGTHLIRFPSRNESLVLYRTLSDAGDWVMSLPSPSHGSSSAGDTKWIHHGRFGQTNNIREESDVPILGVTKHTPSNQSGGHIVVYGDSNCLDNAFLNIDCYWLLDALLAYTYRGTLPNPLINEMRHWEPPKSPNMRQSPKRPKGTHFYLHSQLVTSVFESQPKFSQLPVCVSHSRTLPIRETGKVPINSYSQSILQQMGAEALVKEKQEYESRHQVNNLVKTHIQNNHAVPSLREESSMMEMNIVFYLGILLCSCGIIYMLRFTLRQLVRTGRRGRQNGMRISRDISRVNRIVYQRYQA